VKGQTLLFVPPEQSVQRGPCQWCGAPSVERVEIVPAIYTSVGGVRRIKKRATESDVCATHAKMVQRSKDEAEAAKSKKAEPPEWR
jgi:hypothetical protein